MSRRKEATAFLLKYVDKIVPGGKNKAIWEKRLEAMSDEEFEEFIKRLETGEEIIAIFSPNLSEERLSVERNLKIAEELGHEFFQRLWLTDPQTGQTYLTPIKYLVVDLPLRRQAQTLVSKSSIPEDNRHVDEMSGQPVKPSKGSSLSFPQIQALYAQGADRSIEELIKFRGGDEKAYRALDQAIINSGGASLDALKPFTGKVRSTQTLSTLLLAMHLDNTL